MLLLGVPSGFTKTLVAASRILFTVFLKREKLHTWLQLQFEFTLIFDSSLEFLVVCFLVVFSNSLSVPESLMSAKLVF